MTVDTHNQGQAAGDDPSAPMRKLAMGLAGGTVGGLFIFGVTVFHVVLQPAPALNLGLLAQYFYGYDVSVIGAFVGLAWGFVVGFVMAWFVTFVRNLVIALRMLLFRTKAELVRTRDFLDHL